MCNAIVNGELTRLGLPAAAGLIDQVEQVTSQNGVYADDLPEPVVPAIKRWHGRTRWWNARDILPSESNGDL